MEARQFFVCQVRFQGRDRFLLWQTSDQSSFVRDMHGRLIVENDEIRLREKARAMEIIADTDQPAQYDFDWIELWCSQHEPATVECSLLLDHWNLIDDLIVPSRQSHAEYAASSKAANEVYNKLFWGSNLPAVTPAGEAYIPDWAPDEIAEIRALLTLGTRILNAELGWSAVSPIF